jgi:ABC-type transport system substrate-binding protein
MVEDRPQMVALAEAIIAQWGAVLGCPAVTFNLRKVPLKAVQDVVHFNVNTSGNDDDPRPHMWLYSWTPDYLDVSGWTGDGVHCRFGYMRSGVPCAEPDALVDAAALEKDPARRAETYDRAETLWFGPAGSFPVAPLYVGINAVGRQPWLNGVAVNGPARFDLWTISR